MADWKLAQPETDEVEVDEETLAAIDGESRRRRPFCLLG
jgi:hypothetical protein